MNGASSRPLLALALAVAGVLVLYRALTGAGPLAYFLSAVLLGMAYAAFQSGRRPPGG